MKMIALLAIRNLRRNRVRTGLSIGGIAVASLLLIFNLGFIDGFYTMMIRGSTEVEIGHIQVQHRDYVDRPTTLDYLEYDTALVEALAGSHFIEAFAPRIRLMGLVGHEERSQVGRIFGVHPEQEASVTVMKRGITEGRWLQGEYNPEEVAEVVIGRGLARSLGISLGDELVVIAEGADGSMGDALLEVVGIVQTGNSAVDRTIAIVHLEEAQFIGAMEGVVHEIVIRVNNPSDAIPLARQLQRTLEGQGRGELLARPWQEVNRSLYELLQLGNQSNYIIFLVIAFIVSLGVLNALRMSARERMREFGVLLALGMPRIRLFGMVLLEGLILGAMGAFVGGLLGGLMTYYFSRKGLDFGAFVEGEATYMGVSFSDRIFFGFSPEMIIAPALGLMFVTMLCALWPAVWSIRLDPKNSISGRQ